MEDSHGLHRRDTICGPPLRILSLGMSLDIARPIAPNILIDRLAKDGGGVRGFSMFILLQELMYRTYVEANGDAPTREQIPKPCDMFDLIIGTGTGGLIAIMLGRLRMDLETCKEVYVRMTKKVFETDKTLVGIPFHSTMFKASKLEEAICECVKEHTISRSEGKDGSRATDLPSPARSPPAAGEKGLGRRLSRGSFTSLTRAYRSNSGSSSFTGGNPYAALYDARPDRCKTAVTAVYKNTPVTGKPVLLRSYDSRREPPPDFNCTIWQAGRATSASALAFKPVKIGQHQFLDEGAMNYNPAPQALDEAVLNEWPGREVGVFVSIGTGKRSPSSIKANQQEWWEGIVGSGIGQFAEARRRLINKIDGCEETHKYMLREHLAKRGVNPDRYIRLNVNVGVGGFKMNEWNRLGEISTSTRMYLGKEDIQRQTLTAARRLARLWIYHQQDMISRAFSGSASAAPSMISHRGFEEDGYFSEDYSRLPCCPEDDEVSQVPSDSPGSASPNQTMSPVSGQAASPYRNLRRKQRYTLPLRISTTADGLGLDSAINGNGETQNLPPPSVNLPSAFNNSRTDTTRTWSTSDIPQPLNVERKTSDTTARSRSPQPTDGSAPSARASETGSVPRQRHRVSVPVSEGVSGSPVTRQRAESSPTPYQTPYQEMRRRRDHNRSQAPHESPRRPPPPPQTESGRASRNGRVSNVHSAVDPEEVAPFNEYTAIIPPYPVDDNDSLIPIPDVESTRSSSRISTASVTQPPRSARSNQVSANWPIDPSNAPGAAIPMPPPRAPGRLYSANPSGARAFAGPTPTTADQDPHHRRQVSSVTSNPPTIFSTADSGESVASTPTTLTAGLPQGVRPRSMGNRDKDGESNEGSTVAVVNGDTDPSERRPATSGGESVTYVQGYGLNGAPPRVYDGPFEHNVQRPHVNRGRKPTFLGLELGELSMNMND